ncbi:hypothetical protein [Microvirga zambiensis]|uniref:hypothetical protein n=1 Tax=Microvirga zambiensis TaxID=1402137 RepID=UPI00191FAC01|nr:hypothetical protein [Microvirga zambiensis]
MAEIQPPFPPTLGKTKADFALVLCGYLDDVTLPFFEPFFIEQFRTTPRRGAEAQASAEEIIAAYDLWVESRLVGLRLHLDALGNAYADASGEEEQSAIKAEIRAVRREIKSTVPRTHVGLCIVEQFGAGKQDAGDA